MHSLPIAAASTFLSFLVSVNVPESLNCSIIRNVTSSSGNLTFRHTFIKQLA